MSLRQAGAVLCALPLVLLNSPVARARDLKVEVSPAVVVLQGPRGETRWGRYQFPTVHRLADGRLLSTVHVDEDSVHAYGKPKALLVSPDNGTNWTPDPGAEATPHGLRLPRGQWLRLHTPAALDTASLSLPEPLGTLVMYRQNYTAYRLRDLPSELRLIFFDRFSDGQWRTESTEMHDPDGWRYEVSGKFPRIWWGDMRRLRDGSVAAVVYPTGSGQQKPLRLGVTAWRSTDLGKTWRLQGRIPWTPDVVADPKHAERNGFAEPAFEVLRDGSLYAVLRTTDGNGIGPMYASRSRDNGRTWSSPQVIAPAGVLPRLLRLRNGVLVMSSGRPGVQLRFSRSGMGDDWSPAHDLLAGDATKPHQVSCGYTDLVALDKDSFLVVYSWFRRPSADGSLRKTVLATTVRVRL